MAFTAEGGVTDKGERYDRSFLVKSADKLYKRTEFNDFIYSSNNLDVGSIGLNKYGTAVISDVYEIFSINKNGAPDFISELIQRPFTLHKVLKFRQGCLYGQYRIYASDFLSVSVFAPQLEEQKKINNFLSLIDKRIEKQRQLVESLKKYKRGLLSAIFDRKIRFKDDNGNNFPDWELKTVADVLNYEQPQKYIVFSENYNDEYKTPVLTANKAFILGYTNEETGVYSKGETIIYDDFTMDFKFVDFSFKVKSSTIKMLTCKNFNDLYFMYNLLLSLNLMPQSHQRSYISILEPTKIFVPCYDEQLIISKVLRKVDSYVDQHNKYLDTLEKCKKGLLQRMFI